MGRDDEPWLVTDGGQGTWAVGTVPSLSAHPVAHHGQSPFDYRSRKGSSLMLGWWDIAKAKVSSVQRAA